MNLFLHLTYFFFTINFHTHSLTFEYICKNCENHKQKGNSDTLHIRTALLLSFLNVTPYSYRALSFCYSTRLSVTVLTKVHPDMFGFHRHT